MIELAVSSKSNGNVLWTDVDRVRVLPLQSLPVMRHLTCFSTGNISSFRPGPAWSNRNLSAQRRRLPKWCLGMSISFSQHSSALLHVRLEAQWAVQYLGQVGLCQRGRRQATHLHSVRTAAPARRMIHLQEPITESGTTLAVLLPNPRTANQRRHTVAKKFKWRQ